MELSEAVNTARRDLADNLEQLEKDIRSGKVDNADDDYTDDEI